MVSEVKHIINIKLNFKPVLILIVVEYGLGDIYKAYEYKS